MDDAEMEMGTPPPVAARALEIEVDQEVITIDLDSLDPSTDDVVAVLQDAECKISVWTQLASEYWRKGWLESAQRITNQAIECEDLYHVWDRAETNVLKKSSNFGVIIEVSLQHIFFSQISRLIALELHQRSNSRAPVRQLGPQNSDSVS